MRRRVGTACAVLLALAGCAEPASVPLVNVDIYTDLACPHCARAEHVMARIHEAWPRDVQIRHRHLPLPFHPRARPAAVGPGRRADHAPLGGSDAGWP
ncbi:MAG: DsbA family protein, partial [Myxococcota bacterium]|nr:DsbA family protein [Myxococcota bacterium]